MASTAEGKSSLAKSGASKAESPMLVKNPLLEWYRLLTWQVDRRPVSCRTGR